MRRFPYRRAVRKLIPSFSVAVDFRDVTAMLRAQYPEEAQQIHFAQVSAALSYWVIKAEINEVAAFYGRPTLFSKPQDASRLGMSERKRRWIEQRKELIQEQDQGEGGGSRLKNQSPVISLRTAG